MSNPNKDSVTKIDKWGCCYNKHGKHEGSFESIPMSNDEIVQLFTEYVAEKLPALVDQEQEQPTQLPLSYLGTLQGAYRIKGCG